VTRVRASEAANEFQIAEDLQAALRLPFHHREEIDGETVEWARPLRIMGHNRGRDNARKRAVRRKKAERLANAKEKKKRKR
jgi:hypothetical protein